MTTPNIKIVDRIRRLLALAGNNPSAEEAQTAMLHAQRLIAEHGVDESTLVAEQEAEEAEEVDVEVCGKRDRYYESIAVIVANNFRCSPYLSHNYAVEGRSNKVTTIRFIGMPADAAAAKLVYTMARHSLLTNRAAYIAERKKAKSGLSPSEVRDIRLLWTHSFVQGVREAFRAQVEENNWALVLQVPALVRQKIAEIKMGKPKDAFSDQTVRDLDRDALVKGRQAGEAFAAVSRSSGGAVEGGVKLIGDGKTNRS